MEIPNFKKLIKNYDSEWKSFVDSLSDETHCPKCNSPLTTIERQARSCFICKFDFKISTKEKNETKTSSK